MNQPLLPPHTQRYLRRYVRARRAAAMLRALAISIGFAALWLLAWGVVDRFAQLPPSARVTLEVGLIVVILAPLRRPLAAMFRAKVDWLAAAEQAEVRDGRFDEALVTVVSQRLNEGRATASAELVARLTDDVESILARDFRGDANLVPLRPVGLAWLVAAIQVAQLALLSIWPWLGLPQLIERQLMPLAAIAPVTTTHLSLTPGPVQVAPGAAVTITARTDAADGAVLRVTSDAGRNWTTIDMSPAGDAGSFVQTLNSVSRDMRYEVQSGDATGGPYEIRVVQPVIAKVVKAPDATTQPSQPPEYTDALRAYFEALRESKTGARQ